jgi:catechol 2,3-dioxygenase-like lactoylglutathione lyase family enzyme
MSDFRVARLDHVHVTVKNRGAAVRWYGDILGLRPLYDYTEHGDPHGPVVISSDGGETHLALFEAKSEFKPGQVIAFRVKADGFMAFLDRLDALKLYALGRPVMRKDVADHGNSWSVYFCDPDGNPYEITTYDYSEVAVRLR